MKYYVTINNKKYEVEVEKAGEENTPKAAGISSNESSASKETAADVSPNGETIKAPIPGTILEIKVTEGQKVKKGDDIFILEAMKMENEIKAGHDATVEKIVVTKGQQVNTGDVLVILK